MQFSESVSGMPEEGRSRSLNVEGVKVKPGEERTTGQAFGGTLLNSLRGRFQIFDRTSVPGAKEENLVLQSTADAL